MMVQLTVWDNFYVIIGSAAATLTGLMFIATTLISRTQLQSPQVSDAFGAFNTPTIVHLASALGIAAMLAAPWPLLWEPDLLLGLAGVAGVFYMQVVVRRTHRQTAYTPVLEDLLWHMAFPLVAYGALVVASLVFVGDASLALFIAGAATVLLLLIGIHNAWDNVTFLVLNTPAPEQHGAEE